MSRSMRLMSVSVTLRYNMLSFKVLLTAIPDVAVFKLATSVSRVAWNEWKMFPITINVHAYYCYPNYNLNIKW